MRPGHVTEFILMLITLHHITLRFCNRFKNQCFMKTTGSPTAKRSKGTRNAYADQQPTISSSCQCLHRCLTRLGLITGLPGAPGIPKLVRTCSGNRHQATRKHIEIYMHTHKHMHITYTCYIHRYAYIHTCTHKSLHDLALGFSFADLELASSHDIKYQSINQSINQSIK